MWAANLLRNLFPFLGDKQLGTLVITSHTCIFVAVILVFLSKNIVIRVVALHIMIWTILSEFVLQECVMRYLEDEFRVMTPYVLTSIFDLWGWKFQNRNEEVLAFTSFNIGCFFVFAIITVFDMIR
uniref:Uncharacterized protein n=1 Tax=viral metagenome TaxID=1070528 RepID=A0A6C0I608_9ZZZZ